MNYFCSLIILCSICQVYISIADIWKKIPFYFHGLKQYGETPKWCLSLKKGKRKQNNLVLPSLFLRNYITH